MPWTSKELLLHLRAREPGRLAINPLKQKIVKWRKLPFNQIVMDFLYFATCHAGRGCYIAKLPCNYTLKGMKRNFIPEIAN